MPQIPQPERVDLPPAPPAVENFAPRHPANEAPADLLVAAPVPMPDRPPTHGPVLGGCLARVRSLASGSCLKRVVPPGHASLPPAYGRKRSSVLPKRATQQSTTRSMFTVRSSPPSWASFLVTSCGTGVGWTWHRRHGADAACFTGRAFPPALSPNHSGQDARPNTSPRRAAGRAIAIVQRSSAVTALSTNYLATAIWNGRFLSAPVGMPRRSRCRSCWTSTL
jgi:hypothetical protein